jgi:hypothetical protein
MGLLGPKLNRYIVVGFLMLVAGFFLIPFLIGIPIFMIGSVLFIIGVMISLVSMLPGGNKIVLAYKGMFSQMWLFLKALAKEGISG